LTLRLPFAWQQREGTKRIPPILIERDVMSNWHRNPRYREQVRRHVRARRDALKELSEMYPGVYKKLLAQHKARINKERGDLPSVIDEYTFEEVRGA
jgi:hypothetical protein